MRKSTHFLMIALTVILAGCTVPATQPDMIRPENTIIATAPSADAETTPTIRQENNEEVTEQEAGSGSMDALDVETAPTPQYLTPSPLPTATQVPTATPFPEIHLSDIPLYSGDKYVTLNGNHPHFTDQCVESFESYSELDLLGRCGTAYACLGRDLMPAEERGEIGMIKPSGWQTIRYDESIVEDGYLYNRCHLIGYQLSGENANEKNLITGTRFFNVEGMQPFENMTADYIRRTGNHVMYRVTPMYDGDNLVATGVRMEAKSVEDDGEGISFHVFVYNVQPGIAIEYATGSSALIVAVGEESETMKYVLNTNTKKFHKPSCGSVEDIKEKNKQEYTGTRDALIERGYSACKRCNP